MDPSHDYSWWRSHQIINWKVTLGIVLTLGHSHWAGSQGVMRSKARWKQPLVFQSCVTLFSLSPTSCMLHIIFLILYPVHITYTSASFSHSFWPKTEPVKSSLLSFHVSFVCRINCFRFAFLYAMKALGVLAFSKNVTSLLFLETSHTCIQNVNTFCSKHYKKYHTDSEGAVLKVSFHSRHHPHHHCVCFLSVFFFFLTSHQLQRVTSG